MTIAKAHIAWDVTAFGGLFDYYKVQRLHDVGYLDIAHVTDENIHAFDDIEARRSVAESYRVLAQLTDGRISTPPTPVAVTLAAGSDVVLTSNADPTGSVAVSFEALQVGLPELVSVTHGAGRYGQQIHRSSDNLGETLALDLQLFDAEGPDLWRTIVAWLRSELPYVCLLDPFGHRWFVGEASAAASSPKHDYGGLSVNLVEVTDTPYPVVI